MKLFFDILTTALYTVFIQNLVFSGGYGSSEAVRTAAKPRRFFLYAGFIVYFSVSVSLLCRLADNIPAISAAGNAAHLAVSGGILVLVYLLTSVFMHIVLKAETKFLNALGIAALNTLVLAIPLINRRAANSAAQSVGTGLGAGFAFIVAVALIGRGMQTLSANKNIPSAFQGTPAVFLYIALLSLAFTGFSGSSLFV